MHDPAPLDDGDDVLRFYTVTQVAELLSVTTATVRDWIKDRKIPAIQLDKQYRISKTDLIAFTKERYV